jgi:hypothetical protein
VTARGLARVEALELGELGIDDLRRESLELGEG